MLHIAYMIPRLLYRIELAVVYYASRTAHTEDAEIFSMYLLHYVIIYLH